MIYDPEADPEYVRLRDAIEAARQLLEEFLEDHR